MENLFKTIILILVITLSQNSFSQNSVFNEAAKDKIIKIGLKSGFNITNLYGKYPITGEVEADPKSKLGFNLGAFYEQKITDKIIFQPEMYLSLQGNRVVWAGDSEKIQQTPNLFYLNIPLLVKYEFLKKFSFEFGPQIGLILAARLKLEGEDYNNPEDNLTLNINLLKDDTYYFPGGALIVKKGMNVFDFSLGFGTSYRINKKFQLQMRYNLGLTKIDRNSTNGTNYNSWNLKNSVFQISAGYTLDIKTKNKSSK
jgi:hypothetical protein